MADDFRSPIPPNARELTEADDETAEVLIVAYVDECLRQTSEAQFSTFKRLPIGMQYVYSTVLLEGDVENGGFNQYFYNTASDYVLEALRGYQKFNAAEYARLVREAIAIYHRERWFHLRIKLRHSLESFIDSYQYTKLSELDDEFYQLGEDPTGLRGTFIRENMDLFVPDR